LEEFLDVFPNCNACQTEITSRTATFDGRNYPHSTEVINEY
jgi:hypothetical protein